MGGDSDKPKIPARASASPTPRRPLPTRAPPKSPQNVCGYGGGGSNSLRSERSPHRHRPQHKRNESTDCAAQVFVTPATGSFPTGGSGSDKTLEKPPLPPTVPVLRPRLQPRVPLSSTASRGNRDPSSPTNLGEGRGSPSSQMQMPVPPPPTDAVPPPVAAGTQGSVELAGTPLRVSPSRISPVRVSPTKGPSRGPSHALSHRGSSPAPPTIPPPPPLIKSQQSFLKARASPARAGGVRSSSSIQEHGGSTAAPSHLRAVLPRQPPHQPPTGVTPGPDRRNNTERGRAMLKRSTSSDSPFHLESEDSFANAEIPKDTLKKPGRRKSLKRNRSVNTGLTPPGVPPPIAPLPDVGTDFTHNGPRMSGSQSGSHLPKAKNEYRVYGSKRLSKSQTVQDLEDQIKKDKRMSKAIHGLTREMEALEETRNPPRNSSLYDKVATDSGAQITLATGMPNLREAIGATALSFQIYEDAISETTLPLCLTVDPDTTVNDLLQEVLKKSRSSSGRKRDFAGYALLDMGKRDWIQGNRTLESYGYLPGVHHTMVLKFKPGSGKQSVRDIYNEMRKELKGDSQKRSPVHVLAADPMQDVKAFVILQKKKLIDLEAMDRDGASPLMYAVRNHCYEVAHWILQQKGDLIGRVDSKGRGVMHYAFLFHCDIIAKEGRYKEKEFLQLLRKLADKGDGLYSVDAEGCYPIHIAALNGYPKVLQYFVQELHLNPNCRNYLGENILHLAIDSENLDTVRMCCVLGAYKNAPSLNNEIPLQIAVNRKMAEVASIIHPSWSETEDSIFSAVFEDNLVKLKSFLTKDVECACLQRGIDVVNETLLLCGSLSRLEILQWMQSEFGVDSQYVGSESGMTLLHTLAQGLWTTSNDLSSFYDDLISSKGYNPNAKNLVGESPLHLAVLSENIKCVRILLKRGSFTNSVNRNGETELHYAVVTKNKRLIGELLQAGSDPMIRNAYGQTVFQQANKCGMPSLGQMLDNHCRQSLYLQAGVGRRAGGGLSANVMKVKLIRGDFRRKRISSSRREEEGDLERGVSLLDTLRAVEEAPEPTKTYCIMRHRVGDFVKEIKTISVLDTAEPTWNASVTLIFRKGSANFRDVEIEVFDASGDTSQASPLGTGHFVARETNDAQNQQVTIMSSEGRKGYVDIVVTFQTVDSAIRKGVMQSYTERDVKKAVKSMKKQSGEKRIGRAMASMGFKANFPIIIVPGLASSALEAWYTQEGKWRRSRVWVDPLKIGQTAGMQKALSVFSSSKKKKDKKFGHSAEHSSQTSVLDDDDESMQRTSSDSRRKWLNMMMPAPDGWSDPPGIKIRPVEGLHAIDYLAESPLAKKASYVFGHVINTLIDVGYDTHNLQAAPYDWRIPPSKLEERDFFFTKLMAMTETSRKINKKKVVLMGHSMGCRCIQYFLTWAEATSPGWVDENVHAFLALGPPFLGAPKAIRACLSGDCMGLEVFLTPEEGLTFAQACGSGPWLFPVNEEQFPDIVGRVQGESSSGKRYVSKSSHELLAGYAHTPKEYHDAYYATDPFFLAQDDPGKGQEQCAILQPPPVSKLWVIMGVNLPTEVSYFYKVDKRGKEKERLVLDPGADKLSNKKDGKLNPRGLQISGGMAFETKSTYQPTVRANKSGDGTVPYCSLNYAQKWKEMAAEQNIPLDVKVIELPGLEHRAMLQEERCLMAILEFICSKTV
eukprot:CAMPEP_0119157688 /NCGR_PEP_ID=MMETSP1310-20130426/52882_1 /TAXON_ID=464262 /ORGANISM="Genus nov. species nov., Strain RCC2339" /LENGTH=1683 /DNA_ID=CAMNT_0007150307 /DNA_START=39 /DNA_END=5090 /DNA_ORIENTATION=+